MKRYDQPYPEIDCTGNKKNLLSLNHSNIFNRNLKKKNQNNIDLHNYFP